MLCSMINLTGLDRIGRQVGLTCWLMLEWLCPAGAAKRDISTPFSHVCQRQRWLCCGLWPVPARLVPGAGAGLERERGQSAAGAAAASGAVLHRLC